MEIDFENPVEDLNTVPEQFRGIFKQDAEGKYAVAEEHKGVAEAISGLNKSLKASRAEAKDAKSKRVDLSALKDYGESPEDIATSVSEKIKTLEDQLQSGDKAKINVDKIKEELKQAHAIELDRNGKQVEALRTQLYGLLVDNAATAAIAEAKGVPELLLPFVRKQTQTLEENGEFKVFVVDEQGDRRYSGVTGQPMTVAELIKEMKADKRFGRLFDSEAPSGGGLTPGSTRRPAGKADAPLSATDKIRQGLDKRRR